MEPIDTRLLTAVIEGVEEGINNGTRGISPRRKAELVVLAYMLLREAQHDAVREKVALALALSEEDPNSQRLDESMLARLLSLPRSIEAIAPARSPAPVRAITSTVPPSKPGTFRWNPTPNPDELI